MSPPGLRRRNVEGGVHGKVEMCGDVSTSPLRCLGVPGGAYASARERGQVPLGEHPGRSDVHAQAERLGHWSAWQAARVEVEQAKEAERREEEKQDLPAEIVQRIIEETDLQRVRGTLGAAR